MTHDLYLTKQFFIVFIIATILIAVFLIMIAYAFIELLYSLKEYSKPRQIAYKEMKYKTREGKVSKKYIIE
jgi:predicted membrane protein